MKIRVSATRMELMKLKKRLSLAVRGHRLLKDKQDELVRQFFLRQEKYREHLKGVWGALLQARLDYDGLRGVTPRPSLDLACRSDAPAPPVEVGQERLLNLSVPSYRWERPRPSLGHGILDGAGPLENALLSHMVLVGLLVRKAQLEKGLQAILIEVEVTKRRVNALEYNLIPNLRESIKSISAKLSELELSTLTRLMRVKEIIQGEETAAAAGREGSDGAASR